MTEFNVLLTNKEGQSKLVKREGIVYPDEGLCIAEKNGTYFVSDLYSGTNITKAESSEAAFEKAKALKDKLEAMRQTEKYLKGVVKFNDFVEAE